MLVLTKTHHLKCIHVFLTSQRLLMRLLFLRLIQSLLRNRYQRATINYQTSDWLHILSDVPQGSILGPLLFLIYINYLPDSIESLAKLSADKLSLFSKVYDSNLSTRKLRNNLQKITVWAHKWKKMILNPDLNRLKR